MSGEIEGVGDLATSALLARAIDRQVTGSGGDRGCA